MTFHRHPKHPPGRFHGDDLLDINTVEGLRIGVITRVDEINMTADVMLITGGQSNREEVQFTTPIAGPRAFWGGVPEVNSLVVLAYLPKHRKVKDAIILGCLPSAKMGGLQFAPLASDDPQSVMASEATIFNSLFSPTVRTKRLKLRPGDVGGMSADGAEMTLSKSVMLTNRAGDFLELRDAERLLITQAISQFNSSSGVKHQHGPIRRGAFYLPYDIFANNAGGNSTTLLEAPGGDNTTTPNPISPTVPLRYFGQSVLQGLGPGNPGDPQKFANSSGVVNSFFNNFGEFPPITYSNGRKVFFASSIVNGNPEMATTPGDTYTEHRIELKHTTDAIQDVLDEIDGFNIDTIHPRNYIEHVMGTTVGNDTASSDGMNTYGRVTKPSLFDNWYSLQPGRFKMLEATRSVGTADNEVNFQAGAFLFRISPPQSNEDDNPFAVCVSKQGKTFVNIPGSTVEDTYDGTKNVSLEAQFGGGIKAWVGKEVNSGESIRLYCEGAIHVEVNADKDGHGFTPVYHCDVMETYTGNGTQTNAAKLSAVGGHQMTSVAGDDIYTVSGSHHLIVDGSITNQCTKMTINAISGYSCNSAGHSVTCTGQTQLNYALVVMETIAAGGKIQTILAGPLVTTVAAGAIVTTCGGGAMTDTVGAAYTMSAGAAASFTAGGALSQTAAGALALTSGAAFTATATLAATITASVAVSLVAPQVLLGGPAGVLGIARGLPALPPGTPSLDYIVGLPVMGSAVSRSF